MTGRSLVAVGGAVLLVAGGVVYVPSDEAAADVKCRETVANTTPGAACVPSPPARPCGSDTRCEISFELTCVDCPDHGLFLVDDPPPEIPSTDLLVCEYGAVTYPFPDVADTGFCPLGAQTDNITLIPAQDVPDQLAQDAIPVQSGTCTLTATALVGPFGLDDQTLYNGPCAVPSGTGGVGFSVDAP